MDRDDAELRPIPAGWLEALDESDADLAAGRFVPVAVVLAELHASIARLEAAQLADTDRTDQEPGHGAAPNRP